MTCEHTHVYDAVLTTESPTVALRQCFDCRWWTKVYDHERQRIERKEVEQWFARHSIRNLEAP